MTGGEPRASDLVAALVERIGADNPVHVRFMRNAVEGLSGGEHHRFNEFLRYCLQVEMETIESISRSYNTLVRSMLAEQTFFRRYGRYRHTRYEEVRDLVYDNEQYMRRYMIGLAVSTFLWPNHTSNLRYFKGELTQVRGVRYLEVGPGHGMYFLEALRSKRFHFCLGIDISKTSIALTRRLLDSGFFGDFSNAHLLCANFFETEKPDRSFDAVVLGEVLEHIEDPTRFMEHVRKFCRDGSFVFVTTVVNSPAIDHIYLFDHPNMIRELFGRAGFSIVSEHLAPYVGRSIGETLDERLPLNIAFHLKAR